MASASTESPSRRLPRPRAPRASVVHVATATLPQGRSHMLSWLSPPVRAVVSAGALQSSRRRYWWQELRGRGWRALRAAHTVACAVVRVAQVVLATLLRKFTWEVVEDQDVFIEIGIIMRPKGGKLKVKLTPRTPTGGQP